MKRILSAIKKNYKFGLGIVVGLTIAGTGVYAATAISGTNVEYNNTNSKLTATTVQGAIDEIYEKSKTHCPDGYICTLPPSPHYAFGTPTTESTTDYTTLGSNVFVRLDTDNTKAVCINDGGLFCIKNNDYENSVAAIKAHFGEENCSSGSSSVTCESGSFLCAAYSIGYVGCLDNSTNVHCSVDSDGSVKCD